MKNLKIQEKIKSLDIKDIVKIYQELGLEDEWGFIDEDDSKNDLIMHIFTKNDKEIIEILKKLKL